MIVSIIGTLLTLLKFLSTFLTGLFGVIALLVEYKDDNGKITKWGRVALIGVVASTMIAAGIQTLQYVVDGLNSQEASKRAVAQLKLSQTVLSQVERTLYRLETPEINVVWTLSSSFTGGRQYVERLREFGKRLQKNPGLAKDPSNDVFVTRLSKDGLPLAFTINPSSPLYPDREKEVELLTLIRSTDATMSFFKSKLAATKARTAIERSADRPSLGYFGRYGDYAFSVSFGKKGKLNYSIEDDELNIWLRGTINPKFIRKSGSITSVPDFENSVALFYPDPTSVPSFQRKWPALQTARKEMKGSFVAISVNGRSYYFRRDDITSSKTVSGYPLFSFGPVSGGAITRR